MEELYAIERQSILQKLLQKRRSYDKLWESNRQWTKTHVKQVPNYDQTKTKKLMKEQKESHQSLYQTNLSSEIEDNILHETKWKQALTENAGKL